MRGSDPQQGPGLTFAATAGPAHANKSYASCTELQAKCPKDIAKNKPAAQREVAGEMTSPAVDAAVYKAGYKCLDRDRDGVMCELPTCPDEAPTINS